MLVLQSCTDPLEVLPGPSTETFPASDGACDFSDAEDEEDVIVMEEGFIGTNEEAAERIKQEEIAENIRFPDIKSEPEEVSCLCMSVFRPILPVCRNIGCFCDIIIYGQLKQLRC
jgi:hypothetical protein